MGIGLYWDDTDETVMLMEVGDEWSWDDLYAVLHTAKTLSEQQGRTHGALIDLSQGLHLPNGSVFNREGLKQFMRISRLSGGNKGPIAFVGMNNMTRVIFEAAVKLDKSAAQATFFTDDLNEARRLVYAAVRAMH